MNVLIVEDNVMVAMMLTDELEHAGHNVIGPFSESTTAIEKGTEANPEFAIVDLDLADGPTGASVANHLSRKGSCFVLIASGQLAETEQDYGSARFAIGKPYDPEDILAIATGVAEGWPMSHASWPHNITWLETGEDEAGEPSRDEA